MSDDKFAGRLRELRAVSGLTQQQLADRAGLTKDGLSRLERGDRSPSWDTVQALCKALGVDCSAFTQEPADQPAPGPGRPKKPTGEIGTDAEKGPAAKPGKDAEAVGKVGPGAAAEKGMKAKGKKSR